MDYFIIPHKPDISLHSRTRRTISCFLPVKTEAGLSLGIPHHLSRINLNSAFFCLCFLLSYICFQCKDSLSCSAGIFMLSLSAGGTNRVFLSCIFVSLSIWTAARVFDTASVWAFFYFSLCSCGESSACRPRPCFSYLIKCSTPAGCEHAEWLFHREMLSLSRRCFQRQPLVVTWIVRLHAWKYLL